MLLELEDLDGDLLDLDGELLLEVEEDLDEDLDDIGSGHHVESKESLDFSKSTPSQGLARTLGVDVFVIKSM